MKVLLVSGLIGAAIGCAFVRPDSLTEILGSKGGLTDIFARLYPGDRVKREALDLCFRQDHNFNRLFASERRACYDHVLSGQEAAANNGLGLQSANFVDLWQSAGHGHLPQNDVRAQQEAARLPHPAGARVGP